MLASKFDADAMRKEGAAPHRDPITNYCTGTARLPPVSFYRY